MTTVLRLDDVSLHRGTTQILAHMSWSVEEGEHWVLLGPNGAGKTTVSRIVAARLFPSSGTVDVLGERMGRVDISELHPRIGLCSSALAGQVLGGEPVLSVVLSASYGRIGVWREEYDEFDVERESVEWRGLDICSIDAKLLLEEVDDLLGVCIVDEDVDSIGGWLYDQLGEAPRIGQMAAHGGTLLYVEEVDGVRITRVLVRLLHTVSETQGVLVAHEAE